MERNKLPMRLMGDTGAREGEVASLRLEDLIAKERSYFIRIRGAFFRLDWAGRPQTNRAVERVQRTILEQACRPIADLSTGPAHAHFMRPANSLSRYWKTIILDHGGSSLLV
jgi:hypothetical protein